MSAFDPGRISLVVAKPADSGAPDEANENVGTGYFLTDDLVLTVRHIADRTDWAFSIRAEVGEDRWSTATPVWVGDGDVDAMLLRTRRRSENWALPAFSVVTEDGTWKSAGYAKAAADDEAGNRKTLPLEGSFAMSRGQGPQELKHDPLCISQWGDTSGNPDPTGQQPARLDQYDLLLRLFRPVMYDPANPRRALKSALESWSKALLPSNDEPPTQDALPPTATFRTAQASFIWRRDSMLTPPHIEQRKAAELIFGKDQELRPERLVLFADNDQFDVELRAAVREKWIAAWLYLKYLTSAEGASPQNNESELITVARLTEYALSSSDDPRHVQLRKEIRNFLRATRSRGRAGKDESSNG